ncbi:L-idonate 5-dehydrogenase [Limimaricola soesokkakensis]|uniref:L-idonate 5-dehydrogenase n=1 Tax=Limimaricola soesokkakensis TaxID=1343159 RepID=A0A1X6ZAC5_9RHOB|nr:L-idonate 5-dehydrogenase [Limimaricola soesokkakensis]PSK86447.1 L-idonate 5-dehydrogenase [Limimaricola soesokkakensis]SLN45738.1 L-idonate 5-dehydrogenase (NAD(P)(+)) [Limimaricola soesokkakensis]
MKAVVIHAARDLRVEERPSEAVGPGQLRVAIERGGICGSDLHYYSHGGFGSVRLREPMILGHEVSGRVVECGPGVTGLTAGDLVAVSPSRPCGGCAQCHAGRPNHCENMRFYGSAMPFPHIQGAFRQELVANAAQCALATGLSPGEAAMAEPLAVTLHAARRAGELLGKRVLVTGCGPIGLLSIIAARHAGAAEIVATDLTDFTLGVARQVGADVTINTGQDAETLAGYAAGKGSFDVLFECTGVAAAIAPALAAMRPRGVAVQLGLGGDMSLPMMLVTAKELDLRGSFRFHEEFAQGVAAMRAGRIDVKPLLTHAVGLDEAEQGFRLASDRNSAIKVQIRFDA